MLAGVVGLTTPAIRPASAAAPDPVRAGAPGAVTVDGAAVDSAGAGSAPRRAPPETPQGIFEQPRWVMLRSLVVPGWGQLHNGSWLKALAMATGEGLIGRRVLDDQRVLRRLDREVAASRAAGDIERENELIASYNARLDQSVRRQWLLAGVLTYSLLDAYVDAHFRDFRLEFENDPALPGGVRRGGARVSIRWRF